MSSIKNHVTGLREEIQLTQSADIFQISFHIFYAVSIEEIVTTPHFEAWKIERKMHMSFIVMGHVLTQLV